MQQLNVVVSGDTWRMWFLIIVFNYYLLWWSEHHLNLQWCNLETANESHWDPYALHQIACAWLHHWSTLLCIFRVGSRHIHQSFFVRRHSKISNHRWGLLIMLWIMIDDNISKILFFLSMFKGGFFHWVFSSFLGCMDKQYVKGD